MARWSDLSKLRMDMEMIQAKVRNMYSRGCECKDIAHALEIPEKSVRVIVRWCC